MANIMIVDDSTVMRLNLRRILTDAGHTIVAEAQNGREACALYEKHYPDIVTMDISMPIMSGVDATRAIINKYPDANIVMISALNQKKMVYDALENGAKHYIIKPIDRDKVISVINEVLLSKKEAIKYNRRQIENQGEKVFKDHGSEFEQLPRVDNFLVENVDGTFIVRIKDGFDSVDMINLNMALQGIKFIRPLKIKLDFGNMKHMEYEYLDRLISYAKEVVDLGGNYESLAEDPDFRRIIDLKEESSLG